MLHVVLYEPEIVLNTGSIVRTCLATNSKLHLIKPLGFDISASSLKRYSANNFIKLNPTIYENWDDFINKNKPHKIFFSTSKFGKPPSSYNLAHKNEDLYLVFGKESKGLPTELINKNKDICIRLPMSKNVRCVNLSNVVMTIVYEAKRQINYDDLVI